MTDIQRAMLGDHKAAERLTEQGVLIPCPFCGSEDVAINEQFMDSWGYCYGCRLEGPTKYDLQAARLAWNTRAPLLTPEQMDMLEKTE